MLKTFVLVVIIVGMFFCGTCCVANAVDVTVEWDANTETNLEGYRLFCREEGDEYNYEYPDWEGTAITGTITDLAKGLAYYFVARAYNTEGLESGDSNEVCYDGTEQAIQPVPYPEPESENKDRGCFIYVIN